MCSPSKWSPHESQCAADKGKDPLKAESAVQVTGCWRAVALVGVEGVVVQQVPREDRNNYPEVLQDRRAP